jgi:hypothetical protein
MARADAGNPHQQQEGVQVRLGWETVKRRAVVANEQVSV